jgi:hypothetical protein
MYELLNAIEATIAAADPAKREVLAATIDAYADDFYGLPVRRRQLSCIHLLTTIDAACRPSSQSKSRQAIRLVDRKPEGNA